MKNTTLISTWAKIFERKENEISENEDFERLGWVKIDHVPEYAIPYLMYQDKTGLDREDIENIEKWMIENGYEDIIDVEEDSEVEFDRYPEFGKPCNTVTVTMKVSETDSLTEKKEEDIEDKEEIKIDSEEETEEIESDDEKSVDSELDDTIDHLKSILDDEEHEWPNEDTKHEHEQLLGWLEELKTIKTEKTTEEKVEESKKILKESWAGEDVIDDLIDRAKLIIEDGEEDRSEAVRQAIDEGLIYTKDIVELMKHYGSIEDSTIIQSYYDDLFNDVLTGLEKELTESKKCKNESEKECENKCKKTFKKISEGWTGPEGNKAYNEMLEAFSQMKQEDILNMLWSWLSSDQLEQIHKWMIEEEYIIAPDDEDDEDEEDKEIPLYVTTNNMEADEAVVYVANISNGLAYKSSSNDKYEVGVTGIEDEIEEFLEIYKRDFDKIVRDSGLNPNNWTDPVDLKYYLNESKSNCKSESKKCVSESGKNYLRLDKKKDDSGDYVVKVYENGKYNEDASYFTNDWEDAVGTFKDLAKRFGYEISKESPRGLVAEKR